MTRIETPAGIVQVDSLDEAAVHIASLTSQVWALQHEVRDHAKRFDTLQTAWWRRLAFAIDGWPWRDLNAPERQWRPWHGLGITAAVRRIRVD